jgi:hypothetical protein
MLVPSAVGSPDESAQKKRAGFEAPADRGG